MKRINNKWEGKIRLLAAVFTSGFGVVINYLISLVLTPYITETLGTESYGFVNLAKSISNYAIILTSCLNAYASRFISVSYHENNKHKSEVYMSTVFFANVLLSLLVLAFATIFCIKLDFFISVPYEILSDVKILFFLDFVNYMLVATGTCFTAYAYVKNRLDVLGIVKILTYISEAVALFLFFRYFEPKVYYVGYGLLISSIISFCLNCFCAHYYLGELKIKVRFFDISTVKELVINGIWNSINSLGNILNSGLDLLVTNQMLSSLLMGQLSIVKTLSTIFTTLFQTVSSPFQPKLLQAYANNDKERLVSLLTKNIIFCSFFSNMLCGGLASLGESYFSLWTPTQNIELLQKLTIITIIGMLVEGASFPLLYVYTLTLKNRVPCILTILSGLLNVLGMFFLIRFTSIGIYAVVGTTTFLAWGMYFIFTPLYSAYCLEIKKSTFFPTLIRVVLSAVICIILFRFIATKLVINSWGKLFISSILLVIIGVPIHAIVAGWTIIIKPYIRRHRE